MEVFLVADTNFCVAVVLEVAVPVDVAKIHSESWMAVVSEEAVSAPIAETRVLTSCMAVVSEEVVSAPIAESSWMTAFLVVVVLETTADSSWLVVVLEEVVLALVVPAH